MVSVVSLVSVVSFRPFRFVVSGFSTCPEIGICSEVVSCAFHISKSDAEVRLSHCGS